MEPTIGRQAKSIVDGEVLRLTNILRRWRAARAETQSLRLTKPRKPHYACSEAEICTRDRHSTRVIASHRAAAGRFISSCARVQFRQELRGENVFVLLGSGQ